MPILHLLAIGIFYFMNTIFWDFLVSMGMAEAWAAFTEYSLLFIIMLIFFGPKLKVHIKDFREKTKSIWKFLLKAFLVIVASYLFMQASIFVADKIFHTNILPQNNELLEERAEKVPKIITFLMMVIYAPFIEEHVFRYSFTGWIKKENKGLVIGLTILSIIAFDMIHVIHLPEFFYYLPLSLSLTYIYFDKDRNVISSMLMHAMTNALAFLMMLFIGL